MNPRKIFSAVFYSVLFVLPLVGLSQQQGDTTYVPVNTDQTFQGAHRPVVLLDEAHHNFHTMNGRYQAFTKVLQSDGYQVIPNRDTIEQSVLDTANILVIANALHEKNVEQWRLPTYSAFSRAEIEAIYHWVKAGGSLLLIADHMPFPAAAEALAAIFGFQCNNGFAMDTTTQSMTLFKRSDHSLLDHPITRGSHAGETIDSVRTFTGQALLIPVDAEPLMTFQQEEMRSYMPRQAGDFVETTPSIPVAGWHQGATLEFEQGRIAVFGEAAMFTAQYNAEYDVWFGLGSAGAEENEQFLLNVMHWLSHKL